MIPVALTIAGSDPSGGAGIQADLKTFHRFKVFGAAAITLITVQNSLRVSRVEVLDAALVAEQVDAVVEDLSPQAVKTGALGNTAVVEAVAGAVARFAEGCRLVVDPVMISKQGAALMDSAARAALTRLLLPRAALVTPNLPEASALAGMPVENLAQMKEAAVTIARSGVQAVLIKGGHLAGEPRDLLYHDGSFRELEGPRIATRHTHGTGCTYSAAITALLARGFSVPDAVERARLFVQEAIATNPGLGGGAGPVNHWAENGDPL